MPLKSELQLIHEAVGELALEFEQQYPSALDRAARVCPWLRTVEPELFFSLVPYHKDARTVVAREHGFCTWAELAERYSEPDELLFSSLDSNQKAALGFGAFSPFKQDPADAGIISLCILWLTLNRNFERIPEFEAAAGDQLWQSTPSLLRRLIEADAPIDAIAYCLSKPKAQDWNFCAQFAHRLARTDIVEAMRRVEDLPALSDLDMLLEACSSLDEDEVEAWLFRSPDLWNKESTEVWRTMSHWAAIGRIEPLKLAMRFGLTHPGKEPFWCSPLHHAAWNGDSELIEICMDLGCPIHSQDRKYLSTPLGWLIRANSLSPDGDTSFVGGDPVAAGKQLISRGAVLMPSHLFCPNKNLIADLIQG